MNHRCTWPRRLPSRPWHADDVGRPLVGDPLRELDARDHIVPRRGPVSSISSRHAASIGSSPCSSPPCGNCQCPATSARSNAMTSRRFGMPNHDHDPRSKVLAAHPSHGSPPSPNPTPPRSPNAFAAAGPACGAGVTNAAPDPAAFGRRTPRIRGLRLQTLWMQGEEAADRVRDLCVGHPPGDLDRRPAVEHELVLATSIAVEIGGEHVPAEAIALQVEPPIGPGEVDAVAMLAVAHSVLVRRPRQAVGVDDPSDPRLRARSRPGRIPGSRLASTLRSVATERPGAGRVRSTRSRSSSRLSSFRRRKSSTTLPSSVARHRSAEIDHGSQRRRAQHAVADDHVALLEHARAMADNSRRARCDDRDRRSRGCSRSSCSVPPPSNVSAVQCDPAAYPSCDSNTARTACRHEGGTPFTTDTPLRTLRSLPTFRSRSS